MNKEEKEARLENHEKYYNLVEKLRDLSLNAIDDVLSVDDVISALGRVKTEFMQQQVLVEIEQSMKDSEEEELELEGIPTQIDIETGMPFMKSTELMEEAKRSIMNN